MGPNLHLKTTNAMLPDNLALGLFVGLERMRPLQVQVDPNIGVIACYT